MSGRESHRPPALLRWVATRIVRGPDARFILADLDELMARDVERGLGRRRASLRYVRNTLGSAVSTWRAGLRAAASGRSPAPISWLSWLDVKLAGRMLGRHPGLTAVGGLAMAVAIAIGAAFFALSYSYLQPVLPLPDGERIIGIEMWDAAANDEEPRILHDFVTWRDELETVEDLGAFRTVRRNLILPEGAGEPVNVAEMTASGFRLARVPPLLGRHLVEADARAGAAPVVLIGYDVWRNRFGGDPDIVGRTLQLGVVEHTVVGVMPEGFAFPMNHRYWVPLRTDASVYERRAGPELFVFGRLAPGVTRDEAGAELATIGRRTAAAFPETHERLRPRIVPYTAAFGVLSPGSSRWELHVLQLFVALLLIVVAVNVAILVYARTAARRGEIAVRSALGASRRRVVGQLFLEALLLSVAAAVLGLGLARLGLAQLDALFARWAEPMGGLPFWIDGGLSFGTVAYAFALAVLAAAITGIVPALQATGRRVQSSLRGLGGGTGLRMGRVWTALIVVQVGVAVAVLPATVYSAREYVRYGFAEPGFAAEEFLTARLELDSVGMGTSSGAAAGGPAAQATSRYGELQTELIRRLQAEPGVSDVTFAAAAPGEESGVRIAVEGGSAPPDSASGRRVRLGRVGVGFVDAFDVPLVAGRWLQPGDTRAEADAVVVNEAFVERVLGGGPALGRRVRALPDDPSTAPQTGDATRRYEIVGVIGDLPPNTMNPWSVRARMYRAAAPGAVRPARLMVRVRGRTPASLAGRVRALAAELAPGLRAHDILALDEVYRRGEWGAMRVGAYAVALVTLSVLLLSSAGINALMSFTVVRRRREIGVRAALGAGPRRLLGSVFARAMRQLALGVVVGGLAAVLLFEGLTGSELTDTEGIIALIAVVVLVLAVGLLAVLGPARRGLRVEPTEALRADA